eukprot:6393182-Heterocapsa_arctica.AAC.1
MQIDPYEKIDKESMTFISWPFDARQAYSNDACGVALGFDNRRINQDSIRQIWSPPPPLQGRGGAIRMIKRGVYDFLIMVLYIPTERDQQSKSGTEQLYNWASQVLQSNPTRSIPILFLDANGHVGWVRDELAVSSSVGKSGCELENQNGYKLRFFAERHGLRLVNTWSHEGSGPTWTNGEGV